jgi:hypothetical protein
MNWMIVQILWFICESILRQSFIEIIAFALIIIRLINRFWFEKNSFHNKFFVTEIFSNALMTISVGHYESHLIIARRVFGSAKNHLDRRGQKRTEEDRRGHHRVIHDWTRFEVLFKNMYILLVRIVEQ